MYSVACLYVYSDIRKAQPTCNTGDRLIVFKDHDMKGRSVLFDSSVSVESSQQKEPTSVSMEMCYILLTDIRIQFNSSDRRMDSDEGRGMEGECIEG